MTPTIIDDRASMPFHATKSWRRRKSIKRIVIHTTASLNQDPKKTARYHIKERNWPSISYHDFITKDGVVHRCNNYYDMTWHTRGWNKDGIGVALAYRGQTGNMPELQQWEALIAHSINLCLKFKLEPNRCYGHREGPGMRFWSRGGWRWKKTCPGMGINLDSMRNQICRGLQSQLFAEGVYNGQIDGIFGPRSRRALFASSLDGLV